MPVAPTRTRPPYVAPGGSTGGGGDITTPSSTTDNAIVRWNGSGGTAIQSSYVTVSDSGSISLLPGQTVDGRDISVDGVQLTSHLANLSNPHETSIGQLTDIDVGGVALGGYLRYNGTTWVDVTVSQVLTDLKTVDGAGSGLDADLLDGLQATAFALTGHTHTASSAALDDLTDVTITSAGSSNYLRHNGTGWVNVSLSQVLTDLKTLDGTGSGLDADLLDGLDASAFATAGHLHALDDLLDVSTGVMGTATYLRHNGTSWVGSGASVLLSDLLTVDGSGSGLNADLLDGLNSSDFALVGHTHAATSIAFDDLTDVTIASVVSSNYIRHDGTSWVNVAKTQLLTDLLTLDGTGSGLDADLLDGLQAAAFSLSGHSHTIALDDLSDVTLTTPGSGAYLRNNGTAWVNVAVEELLTDLKTVDGLGSGLDADLLDGLDSSAFATVGHSHAFDDLSDVAISSPAAANYIRYSGSGWENVAKAQLLTDLLTIDGSGSGLDADLLDGLHASAFAVVAHGHSHAGLTELSWTASAHIGTLNRIASFDGTGNPAYLEVGVDIQPYSVQLGTIAGLVPVLGDLVRWNGTAWTSYPDTNYLPSTVDHGGIGGLTDDDHPQYQLRSEKGSASGYAPLDSFSQLPAVNAPVKTVYTTGGGQALTPSDIGAEISGAAAAAVAAHIGDSDPHTGKYPLLSSGRVGASQAPLKSVYSTGGDQGLEPSDIGAVATSTVGVASGVASLDGSGKVPQSQIPAVAITDTSVVASQAAMLALTAQTGDVAVRTDLNKSFILKGSSASTLSDWQELLTPTDTVLSVDGAVGAVNLSGSYAALSSGRVGATQAPLKSTYSTSGDQALVPGDIGAEVSGAAAAAVAAHIGGDPHSQYLKESDVSFAAPSTISSTNGTNSEGVSTAYPRADHGHVLNVASETSSTTAAGVAGRLRYITNVQGGVLARDTGALWAQLAPPAPAEYTLTYGTSIAWNTDNGVSAKVTLTGSSGTIAAPSAAKVGQIYTLRVIQDGTGNRTVTWNAVFDFGGTAPPLSVPAGTADIACFYYDGTKFRCVGYHKATSISPWADQNFGLATLNGSRLVEQNPVNATSTATASKIPIADTNGKLDTWITSTLVDSGTTPPPAGTAGRLFYDTNLNGGTLVRDTGAAWVPVADPAPTIQTLTDTGGATGNPGSAGTTTWDVAAGNRATLTLNSTPTNFRNFNITNPTVGQEYILVLTPLYTDQVVIWNASINWGTTGQPTFQAAGPRMIRFYCYAANSLYGAVSFV